MAAGELPLRRRRIGRGRRRAKPASHRFQHENSRPTRTFSIGPQPEKTAQGNRHGFFRVVGPAGRRARSGPWVRGAVAAAPLLPSPAARLAAIRAPMYPVTRNSGPAAGTDPSSGPVRLGPIFGPGRRAEPREPGAPWRAMPQRRAEQNGKGTSAAPHCCLPPLPPLPPPPSYTPSCLRWKRVRTADVPQQCRRRPSDHDMPHCTTPEGGAGFPAREASLGSDKASARPSERGWALLMMRCRSVSCRAGRNG